MVAAPQMGMAPNLVQIFSVYFFVFEIPLFCCAGLSFLILLKRGFAIPRKIAMALFFLGIYAAVGAVAALLNGNVSPLSLLNGARPVAYWFSGILVGLAVSRRLKLKTLVFVLFLGLFTQLVFGLLLTFFYPYLYVEPDTQRVRLASRGAWLSIYFAGLLFSTLKYRVKLADLNAYHIVRLSIISLPVLVIAVLAQNRTTWLALMLLASIWLFFDSTFKNKIKFFMFAPMAFVLLIQTLALFPGGQYFLLKMQNRLFEDTLSITGMNSALESGRTVIAAASMEEFFKHPIIGSGFGYRYLVPLSTVRQGWEDISVGSVDNAYLDVAVRTGIAGLTAFLSALLLIFRVMRAKLKVIPFSEEWVYLRAMVYVFPIFLMMTANMSIVVNYPELMLFGVFFAKAVTWKQYQTG